MFSSMFYAMYRKMYQSTTLMHHYTLNIFSLLYVICGSVEKTKPGYRCYPQLQQYMIY